MARGFKTGGRDFQLGAPGPGRPKGSRDKVPRTFKASVRAIFAEVAAEQPGLLRDAILRGIQADPPKSYPYLQLAAHYLDGKPAERPHLTGLAKLSDEELQLLDRLLVSGTGED